MTALRCFLGTFIIAKTKVSLKQVHSLCADSRPGDWLRLAKGPPHPSFCQCEAHGPPLAINHTVLLAFWMNIFFTQFWTGKLLVCGPTPHHCQIYWL